MDYCGKMAIILHMAFWNTFSWMQTYSFSLKFHWDLLPRVIWQWQWVSMGSENGLAPNRWQAIIWTNSGLVKWHILVLLGLCESTKNVPLTEGISWCLTKTINCLNASVSPQGSTSCMIHGYWSLHHTHRPLLNATERYFVWPLTQASWSLASCG